MFGRNRVWCEHPRQGAPSAYVHAAIAASEVRVSPLEFIEVIPRSSRANNTPYSLKYTAGVRQVAECQADARTNFTPCFPPLGLIELQVRLATQGLPSEA